MGLVRGIRNQIKEGRKREEIKKNTKAIKEAFEANDPDLASTILNDMWMPKPPKRKAGDRLASDKKPGGEKGVS